jgi:putative DNA primase/helicase
VKVEAAARQLLANGWNPLPLPAGTKTPPPSGYTGYSRKSVTDADIDRWTFHNIAAGMPDTVIGIDVDNYPGKSGGETFARLTRELGSLPPTWVNTSRDPRESGISFFRVPDGLDWSTVESSAGLDIDVIRPTHRYAVTAPSIHPNGSTYRVYDPTGTEVDTLPPVAELPQLPDAWLRHLCTRKPASERAVLVPTERSEMLIRWATAGDPCDVVMRAFDKYATRCDDGNHYDAMRDTQLELVRLGEQGHAGVGPALAALQNTYVEYTSTLYERDGHAEFERALASAPDTLAASPSEFTNGCGGLVGCGFSHAMEVQTTRDFDTREQARCWNRGELLASSAAQVIQDHLPIRRRADGELVAWIGGYWNRSASDAVIHRHVVALLGDRFRMQHASNILGVLRASDDLPEDADTVWMNVTNGLLNWETGELRPHSPDHDSDYQFPVTWNPDAIAPRFELFLKETLHEEDIETVLRMLGYCLFRGYPVARAFMLVGEGANGKSTLIKVIERMLGKSNTSNTAPQTLGTDKFAVGNLHGKFANLAADVSSTRFTDTAAWKQVTSGDPVQVEHKNRQAFSSVIYATQVASFNELPGTNDLTRGFLRRWVIVDFPHNFEGREDRELDRDLSAEADGIFRLAVEALRRLMQDGGFSVSDNAQKLINQYRSDSDPVEQFVEHRVAFDSESRVSASDLYTSYKYWTESNGFALMSSTKFGKRVKIVLGDRAEFEHTRTGKSYSGIKLNR